MSHSSDLLSHAEEGHGLAEGQRIRAGGRRRGRARRWLWVAYAFLLTWGTAYLVLFFADRLPS